jgi:predicted RNA-binding protein
MKLLFLFATYTMVKYWIGVASRDHALNGVKEGICQVCHGKKGPLAKMKENDWIIYYSSVKSFENRSKLSPSANKCQNFVSLGRMKDNNCYQYEMFPGFIPFRRSVDYLPLNTVREVNIDEVKNDLEFIRNGGNKWGLILRRGLFEISFHDFQLIQNKMILKNEDSTPQVKTELKK